MNEAPCDVDHHDQKINEIVHDLAIMDLYPDTYGNPCVTEFTKIQLNRRWLRHQFLRDRK